MLVIKDWKKKVLNTKLIPSPDKKQAIRLTLNFFFEVVLNSQKVVGSGYLYYFKH